MDPLDQRLGAAGDFVREDPELAVALSDVVQARVDGPARRRHRLVAPVVVSASVLGLAGGGTVAAAQWGPWNISDPDVVVSRHWTDVSGEDLGTCETRIRADRLPEDTRARVREYFDTVDLDAVEPAPEYVALQLKMAGRLDDIGRLLEGARPEDFGPEGESGSEYHPSDAFVLQSALALTIGHELFLQVHVTELGSLMETQCSDDPSEGRS